MRLLLDTHIYLWSLQDDKRLIKSLRNKILDASEVYVSSASIWEAAIKINLGKLNANIDELVHSIEASGFLALPVTTTHAAKTLSLPSLHRDPFDRLLIAQALCEPLVLLTVDSMLQKYSDLVTVM